MSEVGPRHSGYGVGEALEFELRHYDQVADDPWAAVLSCAFAPRSILNEFEQRDLLNQRITGYAPDCTVLALGIATMQTAEAMRWRRREFWMPPPGARRVTLRATARTSSSLNTLQEQTIIARWLQSPACSAIVIHGSGELYRLPKRTKAR